MMSRHTGVLDGTPLARAHDAFHAASAGYIAGVDEIADRWRYFARMHLLRACDSRPDSVRFFRECARSIGLARMAATRSHGGETQTRDEFYARPWSQEIMSDVRHIISG